MFPKADQDAAPNRDPQPWCGADSGRCLANLHVYGILTAFQIHTWLCCYDLAGSFVLLVLAS